MAEQRSSIRALETNLKWVLLSKTNVKILTCSPKKISVPPKSLWDIQHFNFPTTVFLVYRYVDKSFFVNPATVPFIPQPSSLVCYDKLHFYFIFCRNGLSASTCTTRNGNVRVDIWTAQKETKKKSKNIVGLLCPVLRRVCINACLPHNCKLDKFVRFAMETKGAAWL